MYIRGQAKEEVFGVADEGLSKLLSRDNFLEALSLLQKWIFISGPDFFFSLQFCIIVTLYIICHGQSPI